MTTDYTDIAATIAPEIIALGRDNWKVTAPRALPEQGMDGPRVIVRVEQGSARVTVTFELVDDPQWDCTIDISGLPTKIDASEMSEYANAIAIASKVARRLQHHLA